MEPFVLGSDPNYSYALIFVLAVGIMGDGDDGIEYIIASPNYSCTSSRFLLPPHPENQLKMLFVSRKIVLFIFLGTLAS